MDLQGDALQPLMSVQDKKDFLEKYQLKQKELSRRQREYKKVILTRLKTREDAIVEKSYEHTIESLNDERDDLRAQIFVANGTTHVHDNNLYLKEIQCHVNCQEHLAHDIHQLKTDIPHIEREIGRVDRQVYDLNLKTIPDSQHQAFVAHTRKILNILEDQLEVGIHRECAFAAINASLREELQMMINHREFFNETYTKLVLKLNSDKKYLIDLTEYALNTFENCIEVHEKIDYIGKKERKERDARKIEMQGIMRKIAATEEANAFLSTKGKTRPLADLQPKEYRRRAAFRHMHNRKINLYRSILDKIHAYTQSHSVDEVIEKFQQQESLYYSYFTYANEISFHMTLLNNSVNRLYSDVNNLKASNRDKHNDQVETIASLEKTLRDKQKTNYNWEKTCNNIDKRLKGLLDGIESIFRACNVDASPLMKLLGDHNHVNLVNVRRFLKLLEMRLTKLVASVYVLERLDANRISDLYIVRGIEKLQDYPTEVDDIVLTQQCPECAEGEAFNMDERGDGGIVVHTITEAKKNLYEKIQQPEMQYRLHSLSQCRLPRSRVLTAKRNM